MAPSKDKKKHPSRKPISELKFSSRSKEPKHRTKKSKSDKPAKKRHGNSSYRSYLMRYQFHIGISFKKGVRPYIQEIMNKTIGKIMTDAHELTAKAGKKTLLCPAVKASLQENKFAKWIKKRSPTL